MAQVKPLSLEKLNKYYCLCLHVTASATAQIKVLWDDAGHRSVLILEVKDWTVCEHLAYITHDVVLL